MATGDFQNNIRKLQTELRRVRYGKEVDYGGMGVGNATAFLPIYHYVFGEFSPEFQRAINEKGIELFGKADVRFMEAIYKVMREMFSYKPPITRDQFFSPGFAERKVLMCTDVITQIRLRYTPKPPKGKIAAGVRVSKPSKVVGAGSGKMGVNAAPGHAVGMVNAASGTDVGVAKQTARVVNETRDPGNRSEARGACCPSGAVVASRHSGPSAAVGAVAQGGAVVAPRHSGPSAAVGAVAQGGATGPPAVAAGDGTSRSSAPRKPRVVVLPHVTTDGAAAAVAPDHLDWAVEREDRVDAQQMEQLAGLMLSLTTKMQHLEETVDGMETRLSSVEDKMSNLEQEIHDPGARSENRASSPTATVAQVENLCARITLLTNRVQFLENQTARGLVQPPLATDAATLSHNSDADAITAGAPSGRRNEMYNAAAYTEAAPRVSFVTGAVGEGVGEPSPIAPSDGAGCNRRESGLTAQSPGVAATNASQRVATSTPGEEHAQMASSEALRTHFVNRETEDRAIRMFNMMAQTRQMLNLPMDSPLGASQQRGDNNDVE